MRRDVSILHVIKSFVNCYTFVQICIVIVELFTWKVFEQGWVIVFVWMVIQVYKGRKEASSMNKLDIYFPHSQCYFYSYFYSRL